MQHNRLYAVGNVHVGTRRLGGSKTQAQAQVAEAKNMRDRYALYGKAGGLVTLAIVRTDID